MPLDDPESMNIVSHILANSDLRRMQSYLDRGRRFRDLGQPELHERYIEGMKVWADNYGHPDFCELSDDAQAEYSLRKVDPPMELVEADINRVTEKLRQLTAEMTAERAIEINDDLLADYDRSVAKGN
ncbi:hypothetical protein [Mesorhizobium sp. M0220]|uniref:hypothetical protein n=1 Tax=Mesorhizobium sp. M0220 TaxID=2956920 RepID=UPI003334C11A